MRKKMAHGSRHTAHGQGRRWEGFEFGSGTRRRRPIGLDCDAAKDAEGGKKTENKRLWRDNNELK
jgi:hypothetical protein